MSFEGNNFENMLTISLAVGLCELLLFKTPSGHVNRVARWHKIPLLTSTAQSSEHETRTTRKNYTKVFLFLQYFLLLFYYTLVKHYAVINKHPFNNTYYKLKILSYNANYVYLTLQIKLNAKTKSRQQNLNNTQKDNKQNM